MEHLIPCCLQLAADMAAAAAAVAGHILAAHTTAVHTLAVYMAAAAVAGMPVAAGMAVVAGRLRVRQHTGKQVGAAAGHTAQQCWVGLSSHPASHHQTNPAVSTRVFQSS